MASRKFVVKEDPREHSEEVVDDRIKFYAHSWGIPVILDEAGSVSEKTRNEVLAQCHAHSNIDILTIQEFRYRNLLKYWTPEQWAATLNFFMGDGSPEAIQNGFATVFAYRRIALAWGLLSTFKRHRHVLSRELSEAVEKAIKQATTTRADDPASRFIRVTYTSL